MKPSALQRSKAAWSDVDGDEHRALHLGHAQDAREILGRDRPDVDADDRAQAHQLLDVVDQLTLVLVQSEGVAGAGELLEDRQEVLAGAVRLDLEHCAIGADRRRADLDQEVPSDREPRRMPAGQSLETDVAERIDQQRRRGLGVHRRVAEIDRAAEAQLVSDDNVTGVGDRVPHDGDFLTTFGSHGDGAHIPMVG